VRSLRGRVNSRVSSSCARLSGRKRSRARPVYLNGELARRVCRLHAPRTLRKVQRHRAVRVAAEAEQDKKSGAEESVEATTQKYGLEAGLWKVRSLTR